MAVQRTKHKEEPAQYYNNIYSRRGGYNTKRFEQVYNTVFNWLNFSDDILECGCGTGVLAKRLINNGYSYCGFDFSKQAIARCHSSVMNHVYIGDAYNPRFYRSNFDVLVAVEVFEHLDDLRVLKMVPCGTRVIFTVPNFSSRSHLRTYPDGDSIREYYEGVLYVTSAMQISTSTSKIITVCDAIKI